MQLYYKGEGRIFVYKESDVLKVREIMNEVDESEARYCPKDFVTVLEVNDKGENNLDDLVYSGKFDMDMLVLFMACAEKKIPILIRTRPVKSEDTFDFM